MAYKFQVGPAQLSGSTVFEDAVSAASVTSVGASSAATLSASAGVSGGSFDSDGDATFGTITMPGFAVDADGDVALKSLAIDDGSTIGSDSDTDILTLNAQSAVLANDVDFNVAKVGGFQLAGAAVTSTAAELNYLDNDDLEAADFTKLAAVTATAAELNLVDAVARGSIIYGNSSGASALLAKGGTNSFLQSDGTDISYVSMSGDATLIGGALTIANNAVTNAKLAADAVDGAKLADDSVDSEHIVDGSIDLAHMSANSVDSDQYVDGSIDLVHMSANSVDSDQYVDGSIDTAHIADDQITEAKLATSVAGLGLSGGGGSALALDLNELTAETLASGDFLAFVDSTDNGTHKETIDDLAVFMAGPGLAAQSGSVGVTTDGATLEVNSDTVRVKDAGITLAKMAAESVDSNQYVNGSIDTAHIADSQITLAKMAANSVDSDQYVDGSIDLIHMSVNSVDSDQYVDGSIDTAHIANAQVTEAKLAASVAGDGLSGGAGSALALDLNELTAAAVDVANDSFAIIDADGDGSKKESIADLVSAMAGAGLTATNGVLDANPTIASVSAAGTLSADVTFVTLGSAGDMTLPTAAEGKKLTVKRVGGAGIVSVVAGTDDLIGDGLVNLDTIGAAVTLVAQSDSTWWII